METVVETLASKRDRVAVSRACRQLLAATETLAEVADRSLRRAIVSGQERGRYLEFAMDLGALYLVSRIAQEYLRLIEENKLIRDSTP